MKTYRLRLLFLVCLVTFTAYIALDTFVIARPISTVGPAVYARGTANAAAEGTAVFGGASTQNLGAGEEPQAAEPPTLKNTEGTGNNTPNTLSENAQDANYIGAFENENVKITLNSYRAYNTDIYVADVTLTSAEYIKSAFAQGIYGRNIKEATSVTASNNGALLAVNGDNYGSQETGCVIRNGIVYRENNGRSDVLCIYEDGGMQIIEPGGISAQELADSGVWQAFSFGPALLLDGDIAVTQNQEVGKAMASNPRTAIGQIDNLHYVFAVADGRTSQSEGLSLYELAEFMGLLGVKTAYNLDGGGSSTMVFDGEVINTPTTNGNSIKERKVNDIVYIG